MKFLCVVCRRRQANALMHVVERLIADGHEVSVLLDANQSAAGAWYRNTLAFSGKANVILAGVEQVPGLVVLADRILVMLSPMNEVYTVERMALFFARSAGKKVYGYSETPCGHLVCGWRERLPHFQKLFVAKRTDEFSRHDGMVVEVGILDSPEINIRRAYETKAKLGIGQMDPWIYYMGGSFAHAAYILERLVANIPVMPVVFSCHGREEDAFGATNAYQLAVDVALMRGVFIQENSRDRKREEATIMQRHEPVSYEELYNACAASGILVTSYGLDGIKALYAGIPLVLCLGHYIVKEKGYEKLPLPDKCPWQVGDFCELVSAIQFFLQPGIRDQYERQCRELYPASKEAPAEIIVRHITS